MAKWQVGLVSLYLVAGSLANLAAQGAVTVTQSGPLPPRDNQIATGRSTLQGRITDAGSGAPLRRASIRVNAPELRGVRQVTTDNDGRFSIAELPAGRYNVTATKTGYVDMQYGQAAPLEQAMPLTLADRQTLDKIDIALPRGGVITGRVLDEFGEPLVDAQVAPMRMQSAPGGRRPIPSGRSAITNDIGEFRLYGLAPGRYYLSATLQNRTMVINGQPVETDRNGYAPTFYPAATSFESAQPITVGAGETLSEITMMLQPTLTARISGRVIDAQGQNVIQGFVSAMPIATGGFGMNSGG